MYKGPCTTHCRDSETAAAAYIVSALELMAVIYMYLSQLESWSRANDLRNVRHVSDTLM